MVKRHVIIGNTPSQKHSCYVCENGFLKNVYVLISGFGKNEECALVISAAPDVLTTIESTRLNTNKPIVIEVLKFYEQGQAFYSELTGKTVNGRVELYFDWELTEQ